MRIRLLMTPSIKKKKKDIFCLTKTAGADNKKQKLHLCSDTFGALSVKEAADAASHYMMSCSFPLHQHREQAPTESITLAWSELKHVNDPSNLLSTCCSWKPADRLLSYCQSLAPKIKIYIFKTTELHGRKQRIELEKRRPDGWMPAGYHVFNTFFFSLIFKSLFHEGDSFSSSSYKNHMSLQVAA